MGDGSKDYLREYLGSAPKSFKEGATYEETYGPAMEISDQDEADKYFEALVKHMESFQLDRKEAESVVRVNLGYYADYYDNETRERIERLFKCSHPILGPVTKSSSST